MFSSVLSARGQRAGVSLVTTVAKADLLILSGSLRKMRWETNVLRLKYHGGVWKRECWSCHWKSLL